MTRPYRTLRLLCLLASVVGGRVASAQGMPAACLRLGPDTVQITGVLRRETYPGAPNFESVARGDTPETGFYLHLERPACLATDLTARIGFVQLVLDSAGNARLRPLLGARVSLRGVAFTPFTGHHHAPLLLQVTPSPPPSHP